MLLLINSILLRYCTAKKVMRDEANMFLRASTDRRFEKNKKHDLNALFQCPWSYSEVLDCRTSQPMRQCRHELLRTPDSGYQI